MLTHDLAQTWIARWDRQQEGYLPEREERFEALIDAVEAAAGRPDPLVLDLGCGPGSLGARILDRLPGATVVAVDTDPLLLALGQAGYSDRPGLRFVDADLRVAGWTRNLGLDRPADLAVSTTALHWVREEYLRIMYAELAGVLRSGGLFLNGDNMTVDDAAPVLAGLERTIVDRASLRRFGDDHPEDWRQWWDSIAAEPAFAEVTAHRAERSAAADHHGSESGRLSIHVNALRDAGYTEIGTLWQRGDDRLLAAVHP
jgi:SAM-dependent methyltransferase